jgi:hypothetical protein
MSTYNKSWNNGESQERQFNVAPIAALPEEDLVDLNPRTAAVSVIDCGSMDEPTPAPTVQIVPRNDVADLERRIKVLEDLLRPILAQKPIGELEQIQLDYLSLTERGKTENLPFHKFRCLPRVQRQTLLAGGAQ